MGHYTVALKPAASADNASDIENEAEGETRRFSIGDKEIVVGEFDDDLAEEISSRGSVEYVEENSEDLEALTVDPEPRNVVEQSETLPWGIDRVDADEVNETGDGVDVAVVDTGVDPSHEDLPNVGAGHAIVECTEDCEEPWDDDHSHGTHVSGTVGAVASEVGVVGVAPEVTIHAVKVLSSSGSGTFAGVAEGIVTAADAGYQVINMSLGGPSGAEVLKDAVVYAANQGVVIVCAAGNSGPCTDCVGFPAAYEECIAVSATDSSDAMAEFTSQGPEVEIAGPGVDVLSTLPENNYGEFSGTSMASPHVAGAAVLLVATGRNRQEVRDQLTSSAEDLGHPPELQGGGLLDVPASLEEQPPEAPTASVTLILEQEEPQQGNIQATVRGTSETVIAGATVQIDGPVTESQQTNTDGIATFSDVPIADYSVTANKDGYNSDSTTISSGDFQ